MTVFSTELPFPNRVNSASAELLKEYYRPKAEDHVATLSPYFKAAVGNATRSANRWLFFLPPEIYDASVSVTEYTLQLGGRLEPGQREQRTNRLGFFTLLAYSKNGPLFIA